MSLPHSVWTCYRALHGSVADDSAALATWLTPAELAELAHWRDAARRQQWLQARRLAKQLVQHATGSSSLLAVQVLSRDERGLGVEPRVLVTSTGANQCQQATWSLSISHSRCGLLLGLAPADDFRLGVDLVELSADHSHLERMWFSNRERRLLAGKGQARTATLWAIKEAVYKAVNQGQSWSPRDVEILSLDGDQVACTYRGQLLDDLHTEIRHVDGHVAVCICLSSTRQQLVSHSTPFAVLCS